MSDSYQQWTALEIRTPNDVPTATPVVWQAERHSEHGQRLFANRLPAEHAERRGTAGDALAELALGTSMIQALTSQRGHVVHQAMELGAAWTHAAAALETTTDEARALLRDWADSQRALNSRMAAEGHPTIGLNPERYAAALALLDLPDDQSAAPGASR